MDNCGLKPQPPSDCFVAFHSLVQFPWGEGRGLLRSTLDVYIYKVFNEFKRSVICWFSRF